ncbi:MAG: DUF2339 domain-containing protein [Spirochaetota bacterium]
MDESQAQQLEKKIAALESEIFSLRSEFERSRRQQGKSAAPTALPVQPAPAAARNTTSIAPPRVVTAPVQVAPAVSTNQPVESSFSWEWLIGGNIIGKIGIVTLIVSTALFMVYALDQGWLSEWIRLLMLQGAFAGLGYASYRLYKKQYRYVPEILAITALAANTIAIYSAHFVYRFLSRGETMAMMFAVMSLALMFARHIRSAALSMILFGGFFALPVIHSRGINEPKAYFLYLFAVNLLYFLLNLRSSHQKSEGSVHTLWVIALGNALSVFGWVGTYNQYSTTALIFCTLTLAILLHAAHTGLWPERQRHVLRPAAILFVNLLGATMVSSVLSTNKIFSSEVTALAMLCVAAVNFLVLQVLSQNQRHIPSAALVVLLLMTVGISIMLEGPAERLVQALLLTLAMYVAARGNDRLLFAGTAAANGVNFVALLGSLGYGSERWFLINFQAAGFLFYTVAAIWLRLRSLWPEKLNFGPVLTAVALLASFVGIVTELQRIITGKDARLLMLTLVFASYALVLLVIGFRRQKVWFRQAGLAFMGLAILKFYLVDIWQWDKSIRILAGIIMGGGLVIISFYYEKFRGKFRELGAILILAGIALPSGDIEAAEKFRPNRYRYVKELALPAEGIEGKRYGSTLIDAELYKAAGENDLRLVHDGKVVPYSRQLRKKTSDEKVEKEIPVAELVYSVDGENTAVYVFENRDRIRVSRLRLTFQEQDYTREVSIYQRPGKFQNNTLAKSVTLARKAGKPEFHTIDFPAVSGELQVQIRNDDDEPIKLTQFVAVSDKEYLLFRLPEKLQESAKPLKLFYGADYAQKPKYDIADNLNEEDSLAEFVLRPQAANPEFRLTLLDPPYSVWMFRTVFWLLLALIAWRMYSIYRKDRAEPAA